MATDKCNEAKKAIEGEEQAMNNITFITDRLRFVMDMAVAISAVCQIFAIPPALTESGPVS